MSIDKRPNGKYRARVRKYAGGPERTKCFVRKVDAERWVAEQRVAVARGTYITADEMRVAFAQFIAASPACDADELLEELAFISGESIRLSERAVESEARASRASR